MRPRVVVVLLLQDGFLVKTRQFKKPLYVGDPINAVKILNEKEVDELVILDICASDRGGPDLTLVRDIASEAFMPVSYGGGISTLNHAKGVFATGIEKVVVNRAAIARPQIIGEIARMSGSQSLTISLDVDRTKRGLSTVGAGAGKRTTQLDPIEWARAAEANGAGELFLTSVHSEGMMRGMDLDLISKISHSVSIPVVANGGAAELSDLRKAIEAGAAAGAAGSMFVFRGRHRAVLINYPDEQVVTDLMEPLVYE